MLGRTKFLVSLAVMAAMAFTAACDKNKLREGRKATHRIEVVTGTAIDAIVAFRAQGVITEEQQREIAEVLLEVNTDNRVLIDIVSQASTWDANTKAAVIAQLRMIVDAVARLQEVGALHIKNPDSIAKFNALIAAIKSALAVLQGVVS